MKMMNMVKCSFTAIASMQDVKDKIFQVIRLKNVSELLLMSFNKVDIFELKILIQQIEK